MQRFGEQRTHIGLLDDLPGVHHNRAITYIRRDAPIVSDKEG